MNNSSVCFLLFAPLDASAYTTLLYNIIPSLVTIVSLTSNTTFIYCMWKTGQTVKISNKFVIVMTSSDVVISILLPVYFSLVAKIDGAFHFCVLKKVVEFVFLAACYFSFNTFCCITLDRFLHIKKPLTYSELMNGFRFKLLVAVGFLVALMTVFALVIYPSFPVLVGSCLFSIICIIAMVLANITMAHSLKSYRIGNHTLQIASQSQTSSTSSGNEDSARNSRDNMVQNSRPVKTLRLLTVALAVFYVPYDIFTIIWTYYLVYSDTGPSLSLSIALYCSAILIMSNSWVNALILIHGNSKCRRYLSMKLGSNCRLDSATSRQ